MEEIDKRLKETSENCLKAFEGWDGNRKDKDAQETLQEAIHELRKVASRLEVELAISERDETAAKPLPIPPHRSKRRHNNNNNNNDGNAGNASDGEGKSGKPRPKRGPKKAEG